MNLLINIVSEYALSIVFHQLYQLSLRWHICKRVTWTESIVKTGFCSRLMSVRAIENIGLKDVESLSDMMWTPKKTKVCEMRHWTYCVALTVPSGLNLPFVLYENKISRSSLFTGMSTRTTASRNNLHYKYVRTLEKKGALLCNTIRLSWSQIRTVN